MGRHHTRLRRQHRDLSQQPFEDVAFCREPVSWHNLCDLWNSRRDAYTLPQRHIEIREALQIDKNLPWSGSLAFYSEVAAAAVHMTEAELAGT